MVCTYEVYCTDQLMMYNCVWDLQNHPIYSNPNFIEPLKKKKKTWDDKYYFCVWCTRRQAAYLRSAGRRTTRSTPPESSAPRQQSWQEAHLLPLLSAPSPQAATLQKTPGYTSCFCFVSFKRESPCTLRDPPRWNRSGRKLQSAACSASADRDL